jgi:hypothetical protein
MSVRELHPSLRSVEPAEEQALGATVTAMSRILVR